MTKKNVYGERDVEYWKNIASRLAITIAVMILAGGLIGSWMKSETRALDAYKNSNDHLRNANNSVTEKLTEKTNMLKECQTVNEELKAAIFKLKVENADLKAKLANE